MNKNTFLKFNDICQLTATSIQTIKDCYSKDFSCVKDNQMYQYEDLIVHMAASHSGMVINNRMYMPEKMKDGTASFMTPFAKPILMHHMSTPSPFGGGASDPIGRVIEAKYVDTSGILKSFCNSKDSVLQSSVIEDFVRGKLSKKDELRIANDLYKIQSNQANNYAGLGYVDITFKVPKDKEEVIKNFLNGIYLTGSVGASTDEAVCSVCQQDWLVDGFCDHEPGKIYDGETCFIKTGNLEYHEYSIVNQPADQFSQVLELSTNGVVVQKEFRNSVEGGTIHQVPLQYVQKEIKRMEPTEIKDVKIETIGPVVTEPVVEAPKEVVAEVKDEEVKTEAVVTEAQVVLPVENPVAVVDAVEAPATEVVPSVEPEEDKVEKILNKIFGTKESLTDEESDLLYETMMLDEEIKDAKLSTEKRKSLPSSSFCGPGRSFPVPDCSHYSAAKKLIGRYKGEGDKSSIMTCIERKGKALGCPGATKTKDCECNQETIDVVKTEEVKTFDVKDFINDQKLENDKLVQILNHLLTVEELKNSNPVVLDNKALTEEVTCLETQLGTLRDEYEVLKAKYDLIQGEVSLIQEKNVADQMVIRNNKMDYLKLLRSIDSKKVEDCADLKDSKIEILDAEIVKLNTKIDIKQISEKLNDGMVRQPDLAQIPNPISLPVQNVATEVVDEKEMDKKIAKIKDLTDEAMTEIMVGYMKSSLMGAEKKKKYRNSFMHEYGVDVEDLIKLKTECR